MISPQTTTRVAFQGDLGAFSEEAVATLWPDAEPVSLRTVADVARAVSSGRADAGVLPVENTVAGGVLAAYDAIADAPNVYAVAERIHRICQCLLAPANATLAGLEVVESHPVALAQCSAFLARISHVRAQASWDTAGAARAVAESGDTRRAAIASSRAAERYGLTILAENIEDRSDNQTRFLAIAREPARLDRDIPARTTLVFTTVDEPGALMRALEPIALQGLNLTRIESRPTGEPWIYRFFADIDHHAGDPRLDAALGTLKDTTRTCRILGTYARAIT